MSMRKRAWLTVKAKPSKAPDRMEDPREALEYSYQVQLELLKKVRHGVADVAASRARVESQMSALRQVQAELEGLAARWRGVGGEHSGLRRKAAIDSELSSLTAQYDSLRAEEDKLAAAYERLKAKVDAFRVKKEIIEATYTAAEAQSRLPEV